MAQEVERVGGSTPCSSSPNAQVPLMAVASECELCLVKKKAWHIEALCEWLNVPCSVKHFELLLGLEKSYIHTDQLPFVLNSGFFTLLLEETS